jgi:hypothetical protein
MGIDKTRLKWSLNGSRNLRPSVQIFCLCAIVRFDHNVTFRAGLSGFRPVLDLQSLHISSGLTRGGDEHIAERLRVLYDPAELGPQHF